MQTIRMFFTHVVSIPLVAPWYLSDLSELRGKHEIHTRQSPQRLNVLRGHVPNESVVSSNRTCYGHAQTKSLGRLS